MRRPARLPALAALSALLAVLAACSLPPYDEDLSLAQVTKSKMRLVNSIGPVDARLDEQVRETEFYFLPDRDDPANEGGFLVNTASYGLRVWYLADYSSFLESSWSIGIDNADDTTNNYLLQPIKSALGFDLSLVRYLPSSSYLANELILIRATGPLVVNSVLTLPLTNFLNTPPPTFVAVGSSVFPLDSTFTYDVQYFLGYAADLGSCMEFKCETSESWGATALTTISPDFFLSPPLPSDLRNAFYGHEMNTGLSYLSYWSSSAGRYKSYSWLSVSAPSGLTELPDIKGRIDAVLTSGELLSFKNGACTVHSADGSKLYRFPVGGLKFCFERYDMTDAEFKLYFSLAYWQWERDGPDKLFIEVYAIPTADLADLD